jgi:hypothetical protein
MLQQQAQQLMAQPTRFDTQAFQQIRGAQSANLQAEYQAEQQRLNEDLARRGLSASSIGGGRMGDLAGQQARALSSLDANLLSQAAQTQMQDRLAAAGLTQQLAQLAEGQNLGAYQANLAGQGQGFGQQMQSAQMGEQQRQFDIQQQLQRQLGMGGLNIQQQELAQRGQQFGQSLEEQRAGRLQQGGLTQQEIDLRRTLGMGELTGQVAGGGAGAAPMQTLAARSLAQQAEQAGLERALRENLQFGGQMFEASQADLQRRFLGGESSAERAARERQQTLGQMFEREQGAEQRRFTGQESQFERDLRRNLQTQAFGQESEMALQQRLFAGRESAAERLQRENLQARQFAQDETQSQLQRDFLRGESGAERAARVLAQQQSQEFQRGESDLERQLRTTLQGQQIQESGLDRALRERMGMAELTGRVGEQDTLAGRQFANQQAYQQNQLMVQLAGLMSGGSPELMKTVMERFGLSSNDNNNQNDLAARLAEQERLRQQAEDRLRQQQEIPGNEVPRNAPQIAPTGETAPTGLSPQALAQMSILQQMSFSPYSYSGFGF